MPNAPASKSNLRALPGLLTPSFGYKPFRYPWAYDFWKRYSSRCTGCPEESAAGRGLQGLGGQASTTASATC